MSHKENPAKNLWAFFIYVLLMVTCFKESFTGMKLIETIFKAFKNIAITKYEKMFPIVGYIFINCISIAYNIYIGLIVQYVIASNVAADLLIPHIPAKIKIDHFDILIKSVFCFISLIYLYLFRNDISDFDKNLKRVCSRLKFKFVILCSFFLSWVGVVVLMYFLIPILIINIKRLDSYLGKILISWTFISILNYIRVFSISSIHFDSPFFKMLLYFFLSFYNSIFTLFINILNIIRPINVNEDSYFNSILKIYNVPAKYINDLFSDIKDKNYWYAEIYMAINNFTPLDSVIDTSKYSEPEMTYYRIFIIPVLLNMFLINDFYSLHLVSRICLVIILYGLLQMIFTCFYYYSMIDTLDNELKEIQRHFLIKSDNSDQNDNCENLESKEYNDQDTINNDKEQEIHSDDVKMIDILSDNNHESDIK
ncbi:hypothetical protein DMUE_0325 [Dictyocoela muelleri]|nr:hypothetical protein DMUE_0325 [Dictyocoela muelleri]